MAKISFAALLLIGVATQAWADTVYVKDVIYVPLRTGMGTQYRIIENAMPSGTQLNRIREEQDDNGNAWSFVETSRGRQGWLESQYLQNEAIARDQLSAARNQLEALRNQQQGVSSQIGDLESSNTDLNQQLTAANEQISNLNRELNEIRTVSANALALNESNQRLIEENQQLSTQVDVAEAQIERLEDQSNQKWFLNGALAVAIGCLLTLIIQKIRVKRRYSEWA